MATGVVTWSQTAATNATADSNVNWAELMAPSQVNDSARAVMASVAKWRDDNNGTLATSGTTAAFTVATNQVFGALTDGYTVAVRFHATSDSSATLSVDSLTAKPMQLVAGTNLPAQAFPLGAVQRFTYSSASTAWVANDFTARLVGPVIANYVTTTSSAYSVTDRDYIIECMPATGTAVTLPTASSNVGRILKFHCDSIDVFSISSNVITLQHGSNGTPQTDIIGGSSPSLFWSELLSVGTAWFQIAGDVGNL